MFDFTISEFSIIFSYFIDRQKYVQLERNEPNISLISAFQRSRMMENNLDSNLEINAFHVDGRSTKIHEIEKCKRLCKRVS